MVTAELATVESTTIDKKAGAPGKAVIVKDVGLGGGTTTTEMYQQAGVVSRPAKGARHIKIPLGTGRRSMVSIACHNYNVTIEVAEGETAIYSTTADGKTLKGQIRIGNDGKIIVKNDVEDFAKLFADLIDEVSGIITTGNSVTQKVNGATKTRLSQIKTRAAKLLKEG